MATNTSYEVKREDFFAIEYLIVCRYGVRTFHVRATADGVNFPSMSPCPPELCRFLAEVVLVAARLSEELAGEAVKS